MMMKPATNRKRFGIRSHSNYVPTIGAIYVVLLLGCAQAWGAVGCNLNDPDRDVVRFFPESTGYKTVYFSIEEQGGEPLLKKVEKRLGDNFHGLYETIDNPYTLYEILKDKKTIGYIHGVNQKGLYGGIQVFGAFDLNGKIKDFYIQKLTSKYAKKLRDKDFGKQFIGLTIRDFDQYDVHSGKARGKVSRIKNPAPKDEVDFKAIMRAVKKDFILMDVFVYSKQTGKGGRGK